MSTTPRFGLTWPGQDAADASAATPPTTTLAAVDARGMTEPTSLGAAKTLSKPANFLLEGDNLEALKHLLNAGIKADFIYIDPPYNTGNTFVYNDSFESTSPAGAPIDAHAQWLNMISPRLRLARQVMSPAAVIVVSIDATEVAYLRILMEQIFGAQNYIGTIVWGSNMKGRQIGAPGLAKTHEYLLCFGASAAAARAFKVSAAEVSALMPAIYKNVTYPVKHDEHGPYVVKNQLYNTNSRFNEVSAPSMVYAIHYHPQTGAVATSDIEITTPSAGGDPVMALTEAGASAYPASAGWVTLMPHPNAKPGLAAHAWRWSRKRVAADVADLEFRTDRNGNWRVYTKIRQVDQIAFKDLIIGPSTMQGIAELAALGMEGLFSYPKPIALLQLLIGAMAPRDGVILDFFAGSGATAQAVTELNDRDGGRRRWILVQLDEALKSDVAAKLAQVRGDRRAATIADVTRTRLDLTAPDYLDLRLKPDAAGGARA